MTAVSEQIRAAEHTDQAARWAYGAGWFLIVALSCIGWTMVGVNDALASRHVTESGWWSVVGVFGSLSFLALALVLRFVHEAIVRSRPAPGKPEVW